MTNPLQLPVSPADETRPTGHENTFKKGLPKLARFTKIGKAPKKHVYQFRQAPAKSLFLNQKKPRPLDAPLVSDKYLFLLAKTAVANSCMTCVKILRAKGPMNTIPQNPQTRRDHASPAKLVLALACLVTLPTSIWADTWSKSGTFQLSGDTTPVSATQLSLPITRWDRSTEFEMATRGDPIPRPSQIVIQGGSQMAQLLSLISHAESPRRGYNAVHYGARIMPPALPTSMTVGDIVTWINQTPGQNHAIGRYQIIPATLAYLIEAKDISHRQRFDEALQDQLAFRLMRDAGWDRFKSGRMSHASFMDALAGVWAGLPKSNGRSAYHGYAGNRATITRASYEAAFRQIFPF